jgi:hypothetical protein
MVVANAARGPAAQRLLGMLEVPARAAPLLPWALMLAVQVGRRGPALVRASRPYGYQRTLVGAARPGSGQGSADVDGALPFNQALPALLTGQS